jgi:hypothetical protein
MFVNNASRRGRPNASRGHDAGRFVRAERLGYRIDPCHGCIFVVDVAIHPRRHASRAEFLRPPIETLASAAELLVGGIAKRENGVTQLRETRSLAAFDELEERLGGNWRVAFAMRARDNEEIALSSKFAHLVVRHVGHSCVEPNAADRFKERFREPRAVTGLAAEDNRQRA